MDKSKFSDLIILLKRGNIEALGTHEELLKTSKEYRKIFVKRFDIDEKQILNKVE